MTHDTCPTPSLFHRCASGDRDAIERLAAMLYEPLRIVARRAFRGQPADHTLQPTILVHEAYVRLLLRADDRQSRPVPGDERAGPHRAVADSAGATDRGVTPAPFTSLDHFLAAAATTMKRLLIDHSRRRTAVRRGGRGGVRAHAALEDECAAPHRSTRVAERDEALARIAMAIDRLESIDARKGQLARLRLVHGVAAEDAARAMGLSRTTASQEWRFARAWLADELRRADAAPGADR